jgi:hypothetical protein
LSVVVVCTGIVDTATVDGGGVVGLVVDGTVLGGTVVGGAVSEAGETNDVGELEIVVVAPDDVASAGSGAVGEVVVGMVVCAGLVVAGSAGVGTVTVTITVIVGVGPGMVVGTLMAEPGTCTMMTCGATVVGGAVSAGIVVEGGVVSATFARVVSVVSVLATTSVLGDLEDRPCVEMIAAAIVAQPIMIAPMIGAKFVTWRSLVGEPCGVPGGVPSAL